MTAPTITYGHGHCQDAWANLTDDYTLADGGGEGVAGVTAGQNLYITETDFDTAFFLFNDDNLSISTTVYPTIIARWKTSGSAKIGIRAIYSDASSSYVVQDGVSSTWTTTTAALTTAKTLDHIYIYLTTGNGSVYVDFLLVCKGTFTFPQYGLTNWSMENRYSNTEIPSRGARRKAWLGSNEILVTLSGDIDSGRAAWKRTGDTLAGQVLEDIYHNAATEPFQWFTSDRGSYKVVMDSLNVVESNTQDYLYSYTTMLSEYRLEKTQNDTLAERLKL